ncbi:hypothetical protein [Aurantimonas sp. A3-2-R12]|uniref:hypothetical protein n=1 Tax=Aurantimonas sp. A3-2-R12 TaxID=3114362 RepID=UPI002E17E6F7|nr:hypothetical protein [Aurantimonas sp. A3-2-R12]
MTQRQRAYPKIDSAAKEGNAWAKFTTVELETKLAELRKLVGSGTLTARSLEHQFAEIGIIENELAKRDGG